MKIILSIVLSCFIAISPQTASASTEKKNLSEDCDLLIPNNTGGLKKRKATELSKNRKQKVQVKTVTSKIKDPTTGLILTIESVIPIYSTASDTASIFQNNGSDDEEKISPEKSKPCPYFKMYFYNQKSSKILVPGYK
ncbi:MAG: hypothetical protein HQM10_25105 [Candidatus Riflebacteria bacterium]|nr:hypothetical protein [Candidatus Riflebacteria bacterium]